MTFILISVGFFAGLLVAGLAVYGWALDELAHVADDAYAQGREDERADIDLNRVTPRPRPVGRSFYDQDVDR